LGKCLRIPGRLVKKGTRKPIEDDAAGKKRVGQHGAWIEKEVRGKTTDVVERESQRKRKTNKTTTAGKETQKLNRGIAGDRRSG